MRSRLGNILWGLVFILVGIGFAGNVLYGWNFTIFFQGWWTLFIIVPCIISIVQKGFRMGNSIGLCVGILLFLSDRYDSDLIGELFFPIILILIGVSFIFKNSAFLHGDAKRAREVNTDGMIDITAVFGSRKEQYNQEEFRGAVVNAIFGGMVLDLRNAVITRDVTINCSAIFGGIDIYVPNNVQVKVIGTSIFGGVNNKVLSPVNTDAILYINATCMFGGVDIK